jgi:hypothetical protein
MMSPQLHIELAGADRVDKVRDLWLSLHHHHRRVATFQPLVDDDAVSWERRRALYLDRFDPNPAFLALALRGDTVFGYAFVCIEDGPDDTFPVGAHYLDEAQRLCDRVAIIHSGEIVALDTPAALLGGLGDELLELRVDGDADTALAALRRRGALGDDAFAVGSSLTVPLRGRSGRDVLTAIVIAPALKKALGGLHTNIDYISFVSVGTVGLLVPLATTFAGLSVIVDRDSGAQRELLAAPIRRALLVFGNLAVVIAGGQDPPPGGVHRRHARDRDPAVVLRRRALPDRHAPRRHVRVHEIASAHARDGVDALRARRSPRHRSARHLGDTQHDHIGVVEPRRGARVRRGLHRSGGSRFHPLGGEVMRTAEAATAG